MVLLSSLRTKNLDLEREIRNVGQNCSVEKEHLNDNCLKQTESLRKFHDDKFALLKDTCIHNISTTTQIQSKSHSKNIKNMSKTINSFTAKLNKKEKNIKKLQSEKIGLHRKVTQCMVNASKKLAATIERKQLEKDAIVNDHLQTNIKLNRYIESTHKLAKELEDIKSDHKLLHINHTLTKGKI